MTDRYDDQDTPGQPDGQAPELPLEPRLQEAARAYHPPPATPRDAMWARIAAARAEGGAGAAGDSSGTATPVAPVAPATGTPVISLDAARSRRRSPRTWAVVAAALAAGVAFGVLGRDMMRPGGEADPVVATTPAVPRGDSGIEKDSGPVVVDATPPFAPTAPPRPSTGPGAPLAAPSTVRSEARFGSRGGSRPANTDVARGEPADASRPSQPAAGERPSMYQLAAVQTLSQAEALLVAWRTDAPRDTAAALQLGRWARDVLGSTRLLLDSPAASDPRLRALLDDLELVLAQIVQLSGAPLTDAERTLLERSVRERDLLPRIRSAVPAGQPGSAVSI